MATTRPFAYNIGSPIAGTEQIGQLAIGTPSIGFVGTGLDWWDGPDEELGYVIAHTTPSGNQPNPVFKPAYVGFWRSEFLTEPSFISLAEVISRTVGPQQVFTGGTEAKTWLNNNGFWTSYGGGVTTGNYFFYPYYMDAGAPGRLTLPNHNAGNYYTNPNLLGQHAYAIYINQFDSSNTDMSGVLDGLIGRNGTLTLTQGANFASYSFLSNGFIHGGNEYFWDDYYESSAPGSLTLITPATSDFNTVDPITITVS